MKTILSLFAITLASVAFAAPKIGEPAPAFSLQDTNGKTRQLGDFKGKYVILEWVNFGCPFVKKHYDSGNMQGLQKEITGKGAVWLSICSSAPGKQGNMSSEEWNAAEKEKGASATAVLLDAEGKVGKEYGAKTTPHMFVIDPQGKLIYEGAIDSIPSPDKSDIQKATNYVKAAVEEGMAGKPVTTATSKPYGCSVKY
jgi:peroxiredoxin